MLVRSAANHIEVLTLDEFQACIFSNGSAASDQSIKKYYMKKGHAMIPVQIVTISDNRDSVLAELDKLLKHDEEESPSQYSAYDSENIDDSAMRAINKKRKFAPRSDGRPTTPNIAFSNSGAVNEWDDIDDSTLRAINKKRKFAKRTDDNLYGFQSGTPAQVTNPANNPVSIQSCENYEIEEDFVQNQINTLGSTVNELRVMMSDIYKHIYLSNISQTSGDMFNSSGVREEQPQLASMNQHLPHLRYNPMICNESGIDSYSDSYYSGQSRTPSRRSSNESDDQENHEHEDAPRIADKIISGGARI